MDIATSIAYGAAQQAVHVQGFEDHAAAWPALGSSPDTDAARDRNELLGLITSHAESLAAFSRANPAAPAEALYRFAGGQAIHEAAHDAFEAIEAPFRLAYRIFHEVLQVVDRHLKQQAEEEAAGERQAAAMNRPAPYAGADIDADDRIDRRGGTLLARNPNMALKTQGEPDAAAQNPARDPARAAAPPADGAFAVDRAPVPADAEPAAGGAPAPAADAAVPEPASAGAAGAAGPADSPDGAQAKADAAGVEGEAGADAAGGAVAGEAGEPEAGEDVDAAAAAGKDKKITA